jgi:cobalt-precorrin 5A hydrolase
MKIAVLALTSGGKELAAKIAAELPDCSVIPVSQTIAKTFLENWTRYDAFVAIMAAGITIRAIAPLLKDKTTDPAVVGLDEKGTHAISLLSGHLGGGNTLAHAIAATTGGTAVITTASDTLGFTALDLWAAAQNLRAANRKVFTTASSILVNSGVLRVYAEIEIDTLPPGLVAVENIDDADLVISNHTMEPEKLVLHPSNLVLGIGCNRNTPVDEFEEALNELFNELGLSTLSIRNISSIDAKNDEEGLLLFAEKNGWPIEFFDSDEINMVTDVDVSYAALKAVGAKGVAEPTALLSANTSTLLSRKHKWQNITMALAKAPFTLSARVLDHLNT